MFSLALVLVLIFPLISLQLKDLLVRTIEAYTDLFKEENHLQLPLMKMELTFDDQKMQFYPPIGDLDETVLFVVKQICKSMQQVGYYIKIYISL